MKFKLIAKNLNNRMLCDITGHEHFFGGQPDYYIKEINLYGVYDGADNGFEIQIIYKDHCTVQNYKPIFLIARPYTVDNLPPYLEVIHDIEELVLSEQITYLNNIINKLDE